MKQENRNIGRQTEDVATEALIKKGYEILERNFGNKFGEIDIIARDGNTTVFVEVKAKTGLRYGHPEEMINAGKLSKIRRMASVYLEGKSVPCRIDVVAIVLKEDKSIERLTHYVNVY